MFFNFCFSCEDLSAGTQSPASYVALSKELGVFCFVCFHVLSRKSADLISAVSALIEMQIRLFFSLLLR